MKRRVMSATVAIVFVLGVGGLQQVVLASSKMHTRPTSEAQPERELPEPPLVVVQAQRFTS